MRIEAEAVHAGVDVQDGGVEGEVGLRPAGNGVSRADYGGDVVGEVGGFGAGQGAVEHGDHRAGQEGAQGERLVEVGHEEVPAAGGEEGGGDAGGAEAVGVGFHHAGDGAGGVARDQAAPVGGDGGEVDFEDGAFSSRHRGRARGRYRHSG